MGSGYKMAAVFGAVFGFGALFISAIALGAVGASDSPAEEAQATQEGQAIVPLAVDIELGDLFIESKTIEIAAGTSIIANVTNAGALVSLGTCAAPS